MFWIIVITVFVTVGLFGASGALEAKGETPLLRKIGHYGAIFFLYTFFGEIGAIALGLLGLFWYCCGGFLLFSDFHIEDNFMIFFISLIPVAWLIGLVKSLMD